MKNKFIKYNPTKIRVWYPEDKKMYYTTVQDTYSNLGKDAWDSPHAENKDLLK